MKKLVVLMMCAALVASCDFGGKQKQLQTQNDSLQVALNQSNAEMEEMMATFNEISESFRQISEAEGRVDLNRGAVAEGSMDARKQIAADIEFIRTQMEQNHEQIAKLQAQLKNSKNASAQMKKMVDNLTQQLAEKTQHIEELQTELAARNIRIQELDAAVAGLTTAKDQLTAANEAKAATVAAQDKALNTAWFVFGTKKELRAEKILTETGFLNMKKGKVLLSDEANLGYFTQIDIRTTKEIKLYTKSAELMTSHPAGSYVLENDDKEQKILKITNPQEFWSVSKYLVILVK